MGSQHTCSDTLAFESSDIIDDITLHKAKKGNIGACFDVGDSYYYYYLDTPKSPVSILHHAEKWFVEGLKLGSSAGYYPLGLVYMEYADALPYTQKNTKQKVSYLFQAEYLFLKALKEAQDVDACYQLGVLYFDHADVLEFTMEKIPEGPIANDDSCFIKKQRQKKLQQAEEYLLMAITMQATDTDDAHYMLGILYWQYAEDTPRGDTTAKNKWLQHAENHFDKILPLQPRKIKWYICKLFLSMGAYKVAFKYLVKCVFK